MKPIDQDQVKSLQNEEMKDGGEGKGAKNAPKKGVKSKSATGAEQAKEIGGKLIVNYFSVHFEKEILHGTIFEYIILE